MFSNIPARQRFGYKRVPDKKTIRVLSGRDSPEPPALRSALFKRNAFFFRLAPLPILPALPGVKAWYGHDLSTAPMKSTRDTAVDFFVWQ